MAQKNAIPSKVQQEILRKNKLPPATWVVVKDLNSQMIVKHRITGEFRVIDK